MKGGIRGGVAILALLLVSLAPRGARAQSAIGQLENMTGQHIGRFTPSTMSGAGGMGNMSSALSAFGAVMGALEMMNSSSAASSRAEAERQRLIQEQMRLEQQRLEELRRQRISSAARQRDMWDGSDNEMLRSLEDSFGNAPRSTDFFGIRGNPSDGGWNDPNVVDLRDRLSDVPVIPGPAPAVSGQPVQAAATSSSAAQPRMSRERIRKELDRVKVEIEKAQTIAGRMQGRLESEASLRAEWENEYGEAGQRAWEEGLDAVLGLIDLRASVRESAGDKKEQEALEHFLKRVEECNDFKGFSEFAESGELLEGLKLLTDIMLSDAKFMARVGVSETALKKITLYKDWGERIVNSSYNLRTYAAANARIGQLNDNAELHLKAVNSNFERLRKLVQRKKEMERLLLGGEG